MATSDKIAVIKTGGKQYLVSEGDVIAVEKLPVEAGKSTLFSEVLLAATGKTFKLGNPTIAGAKVEGKVLAQDRHKKVVGVKMKAKKRQRVLFGHKQHFTKIEITKISLK